MDYQKGLLRLMKQCSTKEISVFDAEAKLRRWELTEDDVKRVISKLIEDKFLDDKRYATAYIRDKMRFGGWGRYKIATALRAKGLSSQMVSELLTELVDSEQMAEKTFAELERKARTVRYKDSYDLKGKLMRFALSRGFDSEEALRCVEQICAKKMEE